MLYQKLKFELDFEKCEGRKSQLHYIEHVQVKLDLTHGRRGDVVIYLTSPSQTKSKILNRRQHDVKRGSFDNWKFMSTHFWGENPIGKWTLELEDADPYPYKGEFHLFCLNV